MRTRALRGTAPDSGGRTACVPFHQGPAARRSVRRAGALLARLRGAMKLIPQPKIWWNGELVAWDKAQVHVLTHALHYASSAFEGIRAYATPRGSAVFALDAHVERLFQSCRIVRLPLSRKPAEIREAILDTIRSNALPACYV